MKINRQEFDVSYSGSRKNLGNWELTKIVLVFSSDGHLLPNLIHHELNRPWNFDKQYKKILWTCWLFILEPGRTPLFYPSCVGIFGWSWASESSDLLRIPIYTLSYFELLLILMGLVNWGIFENAYLLLWNRGFTEIHPQNLNIFQLSCCLRLIHRRIHQDASELISSHNCKINKSQQLMRLLGLTMIYAITPWFIFIFIFRFSHVFYNNYEISSPRRIAAFKANETHS